jgi:hypothetical protein
MRNELSEIEIVCQNIFDQTDDVLRWQWDEYVGAMLATFKLPEVRTVFAACDSSFASVWDFESVADAPDVVRDIIEMAGGLRSSQYLFVTAVEEPIVAFGAWWPWGDWETISLRLGLALPRSLDDHHAELLVDEFRQVFPQHSRVGA